MQLAISVDPPVFGVEFPDVMFFLFEQVESVLSMNFFNDRNFHIRNFVVCLIEVKTCRFLQIFAVDISSVLSPTGIMAATGFFRKGHFLADLTLSLSQFFCDSNKKSAISDLLTLI